ncbi:MAG: hypothetical protein LBM07_06240 [Culturomica sp.]|nr:hypothetical protein [Culturomica sp.]
MAAGNKLQTVKKKPQEIKMEDKTLNEKYMKMIDDIYTTLEHLHIKGYIWGGLVQDILEGHFSREHNDLDMFIENLVEIKDSFMEEMTTKNYKCSFENTMSMMRIEANDIHCGMNPLKIINNTAQWKHIGDLGFVMFPKDWLDNNYRQFYNLNVLLSGYKFEYCFRKMATHLNPQWKTRPKDAEAIKYFSKKIADDNIKGEELLSKCWSYNPFWFKYGYNGCEEPVVVMGKDYI